MVKGIVSFYQTKPCNCLVGALQPLRCRAIKAAWHTCYKTIYVGLGCFSSVPITKVIANQPDHHGILCSQASSIVGASQQFEVYNVRLQQANFVLQLGMTVQDLA